MATAARAREIRAQETPAQLRKLTAREVVYLGNTGAAVLHVRLHKDAAARALTAEIWWNPDSAPPELARVQARITQLLGLWVWDGWTAHVETSPSPKPDVVWDMFAQKFVPRGAYRPLGTRGRVRRVAHTA